MDCEKFETTMIDELYGELDELTSAASKRHVAGCARCSALIGGLRATRRVATLPVVAPSEGFEDRILAATREARSAMKPKVGLAQVISWAGRWAMRPQTAMAAVLLLMVGTSGMFLSRKAAKDSPASASYVVTENGAPDVPAADKSGLPASVDPTAAALAHGVPVPPRAAPAPLAAMASAAPTVGVPGAPSPSGAWGGVADDETKSNESLRAEGPSLGSMGHTRGYAAKPAARMSPSPFDESKSAAQSQGGAGQGYAIPPPPPPVASGSPLKKDGSPSGFAQGRAQYAAHDYAGAQQTFDGLAGQGDIASALWAARSLRDGAGGCGGAASRFDQVANQAWGTATGYDATLEGGECYLALGQSDAARTRFARLLTVPAYASRAQSDIDGMSQVAAKAVRRAAAPTKATASPNAAAAPVAPPAAAPAEPASEGKK